MELTIALDAASIGERTDAMAARMNDFSPYWETVASPMLASLFLSTWESQGSNINGTPWAPLTETTLALKARRHREQMGILRDSDRLLQSLTVRGDADQLRVVNPSSLFYGTGVNRAGKPYPLYLQSGWTMNKIFGRPVEEREVPARPFVPATLPGSFADAIQSTILDYIQHGLA